VRALGHSVAALSALAAAPVGAAALALRPGWRVGLRERLGAAAMSPGAVWVHGASVGEILAARGLVDALGAVGHAVVTSTQTVTGRSVMRRARPELPCSLAPLDHPWLVERSLARSRPAALVLVEGELWPSWIAAASRRGIPVVLVSGRISERSFARQRLVRPFVARTLRRLAAIGARTAEAAERFCFLGARADAVVVTGDLKLDCDPSAPDLAADLDALVGKVPLVVAASTHAGEERAVLEAFQAVEAAAIPAALVLAPRRPDRARDVAGLVRAAGRTPRRRTAPGPGPLRPGEVLLLDSLGELAAVSARAQVAFVGGTLEPIGGHNLLEPVFVGTPVLYGPHTGNVENAVAILERSGAGRRVSDAADLGRELVALLSEAAGARERGLRGRAALAEHRGSSAIAAELVLRAIAGPSPASRGS
jgi:3-deoxy-D-manno-octulosonic-acid transferase